MSARARRALLEVALVVGVIVAGFVALQTVARYAEADATVGLVGAFGGAVRILSDHSILVAPARGGPFRVVVTPACSSLPSVLALGALLAVTPRRLAPHRAVAFALAAGAVVAGNVLRIAGSVTVGLVTDRRSLVLFHDVIGSAFGVASVVFAYLLVLALALPSRRTEASVPVLEEVVRA